MHPNMGAVVIECNIGLAPSLKILSATHLSSVVTRIGTNRPEAASTVSDVSKSLAVSECWCSRHYMCATLKHAIGNMYALTTEHRSYVGYTGFHSHFTRDLVYDNGTRVTAPSSL